MNDTNALDTLASNPLFRRFSIADLSLLLTRGSRRMYPRYAHLIRAGHPTDKPLCIVLQGSAMCRVPAATRLVAR